ncbi:Oidioi.mRNA.OKI2018_I69.chr2.g5901.t1.cds [Oikopleura dioica]|uniref:Oidioi.mRNA.OKI2018_I69.chr2.g5901.t1.cds n=1 Tax=Oikopleura dioica TaxID=34765 RepID=A0ABN7T5B2_OIKDI|nr:Oidioi.mRNA.OKI2018_I69.chr2.g5901.t1.cds [Oikopleura dioica]
MHRFGTIFNRNGRRRPDCPPEVVDLENLTRLNELIPTNIGEDAPAAPLPQEQSANFANWPGVPSALPAAYAFSPYGAMGVNPVFQFPVGFNAPHRFVPGTPIGAPLPPSPFVGLDPHFVKGARLYQHPSSLTPNAIFPYPMFPPSMGGSGQFFRFGPTREFEVGYEGIPQQPSDVADAHPRLLQQRRVEQRDARRIGSMEALDQVGLDEPTTSRKRPTDNAGVFGQPPSKNARGGSYGVVWIKGAPVNVANHGRTILRITPEDAVYAGYGNHLFPMPIKRPGVTFTRPLLTEAENVHKNGSDPLSVVLMRISNFYKEKHAQLADLERELSDGHYSIVVSTPTVAVSFGGADVWGDEL